MFQTTVIDHLTKQYVVPNDKPFAHLPLDLLPLTLQPINDKPLACVGNNWVQVVSYGFLVELWEYTGGSTFINHKLPAFEAGGGCMGHHKPTVKIVTPYNGTDMITVSVVQDPNFRILVCTVQMQDIITPMKTTNFWTITHYNLENQK